MPNATLRSAADPGRDPRAAERFAHVDDLRRRGHNEAAEHAAVHALAEHPYDAEGHYLLARIHAARGDAQRARDEWETTLRLDPNHSGAREALASRPAPASAPVAPEDEDTLPRGMRAVPPAEQAAGEGAASQARPIARAGSENPGPERPTVSNLSMPSFADPRMVAALLTDGDGMVVAQHALDGIGDAACQTLGALLSSLAGETAQVLGGLGLGDWRSLSVECASGALGLAPASDGHVVILAVRTGMPLGLARRYLLAAQRHARAAMESA